MSIPRPEYPRPQFVRSDWLCLNGEWEFEIDNGDSGLERGLCDRPLTGKINVPFCPESILSGIHHEDFMEAVCIAGRSPSLNHGLAKKYCCISRQWITTPQYGSMASK